MATKDFTAWVPIDKAEGLINGKEYLVYTATGKTLVSHWRGSENGFSCNGIVSWYAEIPKRPNYDEKDGEILRLTQQIINSQKKIKKLKRTVLKYSSARAALLSNEDFYRLMPDGGREDIEELIELVKEARDGNL